MINQLPISYALNSSTTLVIKQADLTQESVDVIVNAANRHLEHGGGIARAIAIRGGERIESESRQWIAEHGLVTHQSPAITSSGKMPSKFVFHAVGPIWGSGDEEDKLRQTIWGCLQKMDAMSLHTIAFPAISTGIYQFPKELAASVFYKTFKQYFSENPQSDIEQVHLVLFDEATILAFLKATTNLFDMS